MWLTANILVDLALTVLVELSSSLLSIYVACALIIAALMIEVIIMKREYYEGREVGDMKIRNDTEEPCELEEEENQQSKKVEDRNALSNSMGMMNLEDLKEVTMYDKELGMGMDDRNLGMDDKELAMDERDGKVLAMDENLVIPASSVFPGKRKNRVKRRGVPM